MLSMSQKTKELILYVMDDEEDQEFLLMMYQLTFYKDVDKILLWLIKNKLVGKNFKSWFHGNFNNSILNMIKWVIMKQNKDKEYKPIIFDKDWK